MTLHPDTVVRNSHALYPPTVKAAAKPLPVHRFLFQFLKNPLRSLPQAAYEEPIVILRRKSGDVAWVMDPALTDEILLDRGGHFEKAPIEKRVFERSLGDGVLTSEGPLWRWQRRTIAPVFRATDIASYVPVMAAAAEEHAARWRLDGPGWRAIDADMAEVTFAIIARTMLAGGIPAETAAIRQATEHYLSSVPWEIAYALMRLPEWLPHPGTWRMNRSARIMRQAVHAIIDRRRNSGEHAGAPDLLGHLQAARDPESGHPLSNDQLVNNLLTLLEAGHETTAKALTWTLYLLALAPEWQETVRREVLDVAGQDIIQPVHLPKLEQTQMVLKEAMRLYPPAPVMARICRRRTKLGEIAIAPGTMIIIPIYAIHRHRALWHDPDRFDPLRFAGGRDEVFPRTKYMPFGAGARTCIGAAFAMTEAAVLLATFVRAARVTCDASLAPEPISRVTLRPRGGMPLHIAPCLAAY
jgi:cytochrome P450